MSRILQLRPRARLAWLTVSITALVGAGTLGSEPEPSPPARLPEVVVQPPAEALARKAAEEARRAAIEAVAEHYGIDRRLAERIHAVAVEEGINPRLAFGLVRVESRFEPEAVGPAGALGLTQLMPATARGLDPEVDRGELFTPDVNLRLGMRYLGWLLEQYDGDRRLALTAYNRGPGTVERARRAGEKPYNGYARLVLRHRAPALAGLRSEAGGGPGER